MTDQQRFDSIGALGGKITPTPNFDALAASGVIFQRAYSPCPVCVPARYTIMTGCSSHRTGWCSNTSMAKNVNERTGDYLPRRMSDLGYKTWGVGKFHTKPWNEDLGFERQLRCEENLASTEAFDRDDYVQWLRANHPGFSHLEQVHGERTDMYYTPQTRAQPLEATAEHWVTDRAIEELADPDPRPFFGFVSFVQPHPPIAPPIPYNRMFDPDAMPGAIVGPDKIDHADPYLVWMNHLIWAEDMSDAQVRQVRARYCGEIAYIDACMGRILDALRTRPDWENTIVMFFSDHGDHLGDHRAWQKESYFESACHIPFLVSWPARLVAGQSTDSLASLTDIFGIATRAAGAPEFRDGHDLLGGLSGEVPARTALIALYEKAGQRDFKAMVRRGDWKYIWIANGGLELLFNITENPEETVLRNDDQALLVEELSAALVAHLVERGLTNALTAGHRLRGLPLEHLNPRRILQFERGVKNFTTSESSACEGDFKQISQNL